MWAPSGPHEIRPEGVQAEVCGIDRLGICGLTGGEDSVGGRHEGFHVNSWTQTRPELCRVRGGRGKSQSVSSGARV